MPGSSLGRYRQLLVTTSAPPITGTLAATESGADAFAGVGTVLIQGAFAATETGQDVFRSGGASTSTMFFMF